jgi:hypothetical protein
MTLTVPRISKCTTTRAAIFAALLLSLAGRDQASASFFITPTFDATITTNSNALAIEGVIYSTIGMYEARFTDPIDVAIKFSLMTTGLGQSSASVYKFSYSTFRAALGADAKTADDATALAHLPNTVNNPVTGSGFIDIKTAEIRALGISGSFPPSGGFDGVISINAALTDVGGNGASGPYSFQAVLMHEINEVLGLGSDLGGTGFFSDPAPEDLFRYDSNGLRSYTTNTSAMSFFSIDGNTQLAEFNNQTSGADWGDWRSNPLPPGVQPKVQDAFATPGASPVNTVEWRALDVVGYDLVAPEPGTIFFSGTALLFLGGIVRKRRKTLAR